METALQKMGAIRRMADGGLVSPWSLKGIANKLAGPKESVSEKYARQDAERAAKGGGEPGSSPAPKAAPASPAPGSISGYAAGTAMQAREKAAGLKGGGAIKGKGTGTSDDIPIMASNGEFMIKAKAVKKIGLQTLEALNAIADKPDEKESKAEKKAEGYKCGGAIKKMALGGEVDTATDGIVERQAPMYTPSAVAAPVAATVATAPKRVLTREEKIAAGQAAGAATMQGFNDIANMPLQGMKNGGAVRKMAAGGLILGDDGVYRVNSAGDVKVPGRQYGVTNPRAATPVATIPSPTIPPDPNAIKVGADGRAVAPGQQYRLGGPATPTPGTALVTTGPGRSFTPPTIPNPQVEIPSNYTPPQVNSKTGAYTNVPPVAEPPAAAPQAPSRISAAGGAIRNAASKLSSFAGRLAAPLTLGATAGQAALTDTEDYAKRFGLENTQPGLARDLGIRALGAASDLGNTLALGLPKAFLYRDGGDATAAAPAAPVATPAVPNTNRQALQGAAPTAATPAPVEGQVIRNGNSFSGTNVTGNQVSSLDTSQGYAQDLKDLARIDATKAAEQANAKSQEAYAQNAMLQERALGRAAFGGRPAVAPNRAAAVQLGAIREQQTVQRGQDMQANQQGAVRKMAEAEFGLKSKSAGIENQLKATQAGSAAQLLAAQQAMLKPGNTPAQQAAAEENYARLTGKFEKPQSPYHVTPIPGGTDAQGNKTSAGAIRINQQTGEVQIISPDQMGGNKPAIAEGSISTVNGKKAKYIGGKWVPQ